MSISIITVTYNSALEIEDFVQSVQSQQEDIELWLVDNASTDNTVEIIRRLEQQHPWIRVVANKDNLGLAAANNMPLGKLNGTYTAIVNPDVVLHSGAMNALRTHLMLHPAAVGVAPVNLYPDGQPHTSFHRHWTLWHLALWRLMPARFTHAIYRRLRRYTEQNVLFASGSCLMIRTADFEAIKGYDPMYFLAVEDVCDLCIRLRQGDNTRTVVVTPRATITHLISRSSVGAPFIVMWKSACGSIYHFRKHQGLMAGCVAYAIQFTASFMRLTIALLMSLKNKSYRPNIKNNFKVLKGLLLDSPLNTIEKADL